MSPAYWILGVVVVAVIGLATMASMGRLGSMPAQVEDRPGPDLPEGSLTGDDLRTARFAVVARGYSMTQVDAVLDRVAKQLDADTFRAVQGLLVPGDYVDEASESAVVENEQTPPEGVANVSQSNDFGATDLADAE